MVGGELECILGHLISCERSVSFIMQVVTVLHAND